MLFAMEEIPSKLLREYKPNSPVENIFIEINLRSKKWLLSCSYNPNLTLLNNHIQNISRGLDFSSSKHDNFIVLRDFNAEISSTTISEFCTTYSLKKNLSRKLHVLKAWKTQIVFSLSWQICKLFWKWVIWFP